MALTADDIATAATAADIPDVPTMTKLLKWALLNMQRQTAVYAQAAAKANQVEVVASANAEIESRQQAVDALDAQITALLS
jgi:hypothetical protein